MLKNTRVGYNIGLSRSVAQSGSAPGLGPGGPRFESLYSDHFLAFLAHSKLLNQSEIKPKLGTHCEPFSCVLQSCFCHAFAIKKQLELFDEDQFLSND